MTTKKKVFFIISSLSAGGSERVFWLLSQGFDKKLYDVNVVLLDSRDRCFSRELMGVNFIELNTLKASRSFFKLHSLITCAKPHTVFSTTDHINILVAFVSLFAKIPNLIARASNIPDEMEIYDNHKARFWNFFTKYCYRRFDVIVCQSKEMLMALQRKHQVSEKKMIIIPNPVLGTPFIKKISYTATERKLIIVARLSSEKGLFRLLDMFVRLPKEYTLTIVGDGPLRGEILAKIDELHLYSRVRLLGQSQNVADLIAQHDLFVLSSFTEGFPNVVLESLSVGIPVVTFKVGGVSDLIENGFNGFIAEQNDIEDFRKKIIASFSKSWDYLAIKRNVLEKCDLGKIAERYESLLI